MLERVKGLVMFTALVAVCVGVWASTAHAANVTRYYNVPATGFAVGVGTNLPAAATSFFRGFLSGYTGPRGYFSSTRPSIPARCAWSLTEGPYFAVVVIYTRSAAWGRSYCARLAAGMRNNGFVREPVAGANI
jgi:hypothetical protein